MLEIFFNSKKNHIMENKSIKQKILSNPFVGIIHGLLVCFAGFILSQNIAGKLLALTGLDKYFRNLFKGIMASVAVIFAYKLFYQNLYSNLNLWYAKFNYWKRRGMCFFVNNIYF